MPSDDLHDLAAKLHEMHQDTRLADSEKQRLLVELVLGFAQELADIVGRLRTLEAVETSKLTLVHMPLPIPGEIH
jgi:hypothetical protein